MPNASRRIQVMRTAPTISLIISVSAPSWIRSRVRSTVADLLADLSRALDAIGVRWYLFGAQAAIVYGVARLTADVDVTIAAPPGPPDAWLAELERHGFERRSHDATFIERTRVAPLLHRPTGMPVDVVMGGPGLEEAFLARAVTRRIAEIDVPVIALPDLIVLKVLAGRPKDIEDVVMLLTLHGNVVDDRGTRETLRLLEAALGRSDLVPLLDRCWARARA